MIFFHFENRPRILIYKKSLRILKIIYKIHYLYIMIFFILKKAIRY